MLLFALAGWCLLHVHSFLNFDFGNYFDSYLIGFDNFLRFGFYLFDCCSFVADWLDFYLGIGCFVGCSFLGYNCDSFGSPNLDSLVSRTDLSSFVGCRSFDLDWNILDSSVPDSSVFDSLGYMLVDCNISVVLVQLFVVVVAVELLQLRFDVALAKLLDFGLLVDLVGRLVFVAVA